MTDDPPATVGDLDDRDRELWVLPRGDKARVIHFGADCHKIPDSEAARQTQARFEHIDTPICQFCSGAAETHGDLGTPLCEQVKGAWADD